MDKEGETAVEWLKKQNLDKYEIIHIQVSLLHLLIVLFAVSKRCIITVFLCELIFQVLVVSEYQGAPDRPTGKDDCVCCSQELRIIVIFCRFFVKKRVWEEVESPVGLSGAP